MRATNAFAERGKWDSDLSDIESNYINNGGDFIEGVAGNEVIDMGAFRRISDTTTELKRMRVKPDLQGKGIGRCVLAMLGASVKEKGYTDIELDTTVNQKASRRLYETSGYAEIQRETER